jgi:hypothetical protein
MFSTTVTRNLIGLEDLLVGEGTEEQTRAGAQTDVSRINASNFPYDATTTLADTLLELQTLAESLSVVDDNGDFVTGYLNTSDTNLDLAGRLWRKTPSTNVAEIWYGTVRLFGYNRITGDLIIPSDVAYVAADTAVYNALVVIINALELHVEGQITALSDTLGDAAVLDVGTTANKIVQLVYLVFLWGLYLQYLTLLLTQVT